MNTSSSRPTLARARASALLAVLFLTVGCSTVKGWFGSGKQDDAKKAGEPAELVDFDATITANRLWTMRVGKGEKRLGARQSPVVADGRVYAAAVEGGVYALGLHDGKPVWHHRSESRLAGGPGVGDGLVVVGSLDGEVFALDAATGQQKWEAKVNNEVIAAPTVGQGMVLVHSNDGRVTAFDADSGQQRWFRDHDQPPLTVRGGGGVTLGPGYVFVGNDDGGVTALALVDGRPLWEEEVASQDGRSELDRMADVDGAPVLDGTTLFATSYKGKTVAFEAPSGRVVWRSDNGGAGALGDAGDRVLVSDREGSVWAIDKSNGGGLWQQPALAHRNPSSVAVQGEYAVVGDLEGYLHWMRLEDGAFAARARAGKKPLRGTPAVADGILVVQNVEGDLSAWQLR